MKYIEFWKKTFDCKGCDKKEDFRKPFFINCTINAILLILLAITHSTAIRVLLRLWFCISLIPTVSASIRRLRDTNAPVTFFLWLLLPIGGLLVVLTILIDYGTAEYSKTSRSSDKCPYCHQFLNGSVFAGSIGEQRVLRNCCPNCGRKLPYGMHITLKK